MSSTVFPQTIRRLSRARLALVIAVVIALVATLPANADQSPQTAMHRVFLTTGIAVPSFGEAAEVGDRVVFNLWSGFTPDGPSLTLVSLPSSVVDLERTRGYALSMKAAHYAATRGESDFAAMTIEVDQSLARLHEIDDPAERLRLARIARSRLLAWSQAHYRYRAMDIDRLAELFDDVIAALEAEDVGVDAGEVRLEFDAPNVVAEPLLPSPTVGEARLLALAAADAADVPAERIAILQALEAQASDDDTDELLPEITRRLTAERSIDEDYAALSRRLVAAADEAAARGDLARIDTLRQFLTEADARLGRRRPAAAAMLSAYLDGRRDAAASRSAALIRYREMRPLLLGYEREIRPVTSRVDGLRPLLEQLRDGTATYTALQNAETRLRALVASAQRVTPPSDVADVHDTILSALQMALDACARGRVAEVTARKTRAADASAAAAGALLLFDAARETLISRLFPPKAAS